MPFNRDGATEWFARELVNCEAAYRNGVIVALVDALALCRESPELTPGWVLSAANDIVLEVLDGGKLKNGGRGRTANASAKYRADLVKFDRWSHVKYFREKQDHQKEVLAWIVKNQADQALILRARVERDHTGRTWDDAYKAASEVLRGTPAQGTASVMKADYREVQREFEAGNSSRFYMPITSEALSVLPQHGAARVLETGWRK
jgi:hypothetical protein